MYTSEIIGFQKQQNETSSLMWKTFNNIYHGDDDDDVNNPSSSNKAMNHHHQPSEDHQLLYHHAMMVADGFNLQSQQHSMMQDGLLAKTASLSYYNVSGGQQYEMRNSKYLVPVQELLNEFCNLGTEQTFLTRKIIKRGKKNSDELEDDNSAKNPSLFSLDLLELQRRKAKLLQMLEEVDRRYKHYCEQMKTVIAPFEAICGHNAAKGYSVLASKAMSKHFRCLRDGILEQIKVTRKAMGEKDCVVPGQTKGETPRLRILDQTLRQQKAYQQMSIMESHPWRPQRGLPERSVSLLRAWLFEHFLHPYPSDVDKHILARQTGLSRSQVSNWFINARVRLWKPMVEEMYLEELKDQENNNKNVPYSMDAPTIADLQLDDENGNNNNTHNQLLDEDHKPTPDQLVRVDSECLSSIINSNHGMKSIVDQESHDHDDELIHKDNLSGGMEFDFSQYNQHHNNSTNGIHFGDNNESGHDGYQQNYGGNGNGISLTLGLQQHGGSGVSIAFSSPSHHHNQTSLFYSRDHNNIEDCQQVSHQFSLLDDQNLPYRNLMGAQLLHHLAG